MKISIKDDWKRRIHATIAVLVLMLAIAALWCRGRSFAKVLQIDGKQVARIVAVHHNSNLEITDRESIDSIMSTVNHFRYNAYFDRSGRSGCLPDSYVKLFGHSGREISRFELYDVGVALHRNDVYLCSSPYFADLCQQLGY